MHAASKIRRKDIEIDACLPHLIQLIFVAVDVKGIEGDPRADQKFVRRGLFHNGYLRLLSYVIAGDYTGTQASASVLLAIFSAVAVVTVYSVTPE